MGIILLMLGKMVAVQIHQEETRWYLNNETDSFLLFRREIRKNDFAYFTHYYRLCGTPFTKTHNNPKAA